MLVANYGTRRIVWVLTGCHTVNLVQGQAISDISTILVLALPGVDAVSTSVSNGAMWRPRFDLLRILVWFRCRFAASHFREPLSASAEASVVCRSDSGCNI